MLRPKFRLRNQRLFLWLNRFVLPLFYIRHWGCETAVVNGGKGSRFKVRVNTTDRLLIWEIWKLEMYAHERAPIRTADTVVDIGAHIGVFANWAARRANEGRVFAYEPSSGNYRLLVENARLNGSANLAPINRAVYDRAGSFTFNQPGGHGAMGSLLQDAASRQEQVETVTLEDVYESNGIDRIDFLKLDAEGAEFPILLNAPDAALQGIRRMVLEYHEFDGAPWKPDDLVARLEESGFTVSEEGDVPGQRWFTGTGVIWAWREARR